GSADSRVIPPGAAPAPRRASPYKGWGPCASTTPAAPRWRRSSVCAGRGRGGRQGRSSPWSGIVGRFRPMLYHLRLRGEGREGDDDMLMLDAETRGELWLRLVEAIESYLNGVGEARVAPALDVEAIRGALAPFDFARPRDPLAALDFAVESLWKW